MSARGAKRQVVASRAGPQEADAPTVEVHRWSREAEG